MDTPLPSAASLMPLVGDCELVLQRPVSYEPPLYLFPELLPKVPEGTTALSVSDAVSDAVDVAASSLNIAELFHVPQIKSQDGSHNLQRRDEDVTSSSADHTTAPASRSSLASLLASNRLQMAGLTPEMLQRGKFSSGSIVEELLKLKDRAGLSVDEAKTIMSNHFINLLAWRTLVEINSQASRSMGKEEEEVDNDHCENEEGGGGGGGGGEEPVAPRRQRCGSGSARVRRLREDAESGIELGMLRPSDDPWGSDVALDPGVFIAAAERNVERRIELIDTLTSLYRRPWRTLHSRGIQTDRFTPVTINETAPYVDPAKLPGAMLDPEELGWKPRARDNDSNNHYWTLCVRSTSTSASQVIPMRGRFMHFGRTTGVTNATNGGVTDVHVGLSTFTTHPEFLSIHHFSLAVFPEEPARSGDGTGELPAQHASGAIPETNGNEKSCLWLMNYGRNGTRIVGKRWALGGMVRLDFGDVLQPTNDIHIAIGGRPPTGGDEKQGVRVMVPGAAEGTVKLEPDTTMEE